ncbi:unnamed protein product, partial [Parnassius apollo]
RSCCIWYSTKSRHSNTKVLNCLDN